MFTKTTLLALLSTAFAAPTPQTTASSEIPSPFGGVAIHSGSDFQYSAVNAAGFELWLNKETSSYCPEIDGLTCPEKPSTLFIGGTNTLGLDTAVAGGQIIYIASDGRAKYTQAHSGNVGEGSYQSGFSVDNGYLRFNNASWYACPTEDAYAVYAADVKDNTDGSCVGFSFLVVAAGETAEGAYQYN